MKTIAIDFDGVIHAYSRGWGDGTCYDVPVAGSGAAIKKLLKEYRVFILSTRDTEQIAVWMGKYFPDIPCGKVPDSEPFWNLDHVVGVTNRKLAAIAYIDDRGIRFTHWNDVLNYFG